MTTYGLTDEGFVMKPLSVIKSEIETSIRDNVDQGFDLSTASPFGQLVGVLSSDVREIWEQTAEIRAARDPRDAVRASLDDVCAITGTHRADETFSECPATFNVDPGTYDAGTLIAFVAGSPTSRFANVDDIVNSGGSAADVVGVARCLTAGPVRANDGTLNQISSPVTGWHSVVNTADAVLGSDVEEDPPLRVRRDQELAAPGGSNFDAARADLLRWLVEDLGLTRASVQILNNDGDVTDGDGLPPHSFSVVIYDGTSGGTAVSDDDIAAKIWAVKPLGIQTYGTSTGTTTASDGGDRVISFSRPTIKLLYVEFDVKADPDVWLGAPSILLVQQAISDYGQAKLLGGVDVIKKRLETVAMAVQGTGIWDITATRLGFSPSPVGTINLAVTAFQLAVADTARVLVNPTLEVPP